MKWAHMGSVGYYVTKNSVDNIEFGHPRCVCNNEVEYIEGQNTNKFIG